MAHIHLLGYTPADIGTLSGGSWETSLPASNLNDIQPSVLARTTDALTTSTKLIMDCGRSTSFSMFALINHNMSSASTIRVRVSVNSDGSSPTLDVTVAGRPANIAWGSLAWGVFPWDGISTETEIGGQKWFYKNPASVFGRYVLIDIVDPDNADGYVQAGRFKAGEAFVPSINMAYGATIEFIDDSPQSRAISGALWSDKKPLRRKLSCQLSWLTQAEAIGAVYQIKRDAGTTGDVLCVYDPDDENDVVGRRTIYGHFVSLGAVVTANQTIDKQYSTTIEIEDMI